MASIRLPALALATPEVADDFGHLHHIAGVQLLEIGLVSPRPVGRVFSVLRAPHTEEPTNWSRRYKANLEKLHSGNVMKVAEVVRDLWRRERERGLSAGEKRMLAKARQILVSELALAERVAEDKAEICSTRFSPPEPDPRCESASVG